MTDQDTVTEPVADAPEPAPEPEVAPEVEAVEPAQPEGDDPTPEPEAPEPDQPVVQPDPMDALADLAEPLSEQDTVEVELNGLKFRVPAAFKDGYMQHADYTTKTQEVADKGRTLDSEREAFTQQVEAYRRNVQDWGELTHTDKQLDDFRQVNWQQLYEQDPEQHQQLSVQFNVLRDQREVLAQRIQQRESESRVTAERETANRKNQLAARLVRDIPNYTPELHGQLDQIAVEVGFKPEEIAAYADERHYKILDLARIGAEVLKRQRAARKQPAPKPVTPVPQVKGGRTPDSGPTDKQGVDAWMSSRNKQLRKQDTG